MLFTPLAWAADGGGAKEQAQRQQDQPLNNAPVWREVRKGENPYQTTQVRGIETNMLVQTAGRDLAPDPQRAHHDLRRLAAGDRGGR